MKIELYEFDHGDGTYLRLNDSNAKVTIAANDYLPAGIRRNEISGDVGKGSQEVEVTLPRRLAGRLVEYVEDLGGGTNVLTIYTCDPDAQTAVQLFQGSLEEYETGDLELTIKVRSQYARKAESAARVMIVPGCVLDLFSTRCGVPDSDWEAYGTITTIDGRTVGVSFSGQGASLSTPPLNNDFRYGKFTSQGEWRMVVASSEDYEVELMVALSPRVSAGDSFLMYGGCEKTIEACRVKFNNFLNFLGFPYAPYEDLIFLGRKGEMGGGGKK